LYYWICSRQYSFDFLLSYDEMTSV